MALLHEMWKPKATLRSIAVYKGIFLPGGLIEYVHSKESSSPSNGRAEVSGSVTAANSRSLPRRYLGSSIVVSSSCRIPAAGLNSSTVVSIKRRPLLSRESIPRGFSTSTIKCLLRQNYRYCPVKVATGFGASVVGWVSEAGLYSLSRQSMGRVLTEKQRLVMPIQGFDKENSALHVWNEHKWCGNHTQVDSDEIVDVEACKYKPKVFMSTDSRIFVIKDIDGYCEAYDQSEVERSAVGVYICIQSMISKSVLVRHFLDAQSASSLSVGHCPFEPVSVVSVADSFLEKCAGKASSGSECSGYHDLRYSEDLARNSDNEGEHRKLRLRSGAWCLPHPNKLKTGGEDAYFICSEEQVVGVADGVGGWADLGVDAGVYARELMFQSQLAVALEPHGCIDPARILVQAHSRTKCRGSSTACILALSDHGLQAANLGDSGFVLMRYGRTVFKSPVQQHQFNIPFQLESRGSDSPSSAEVFSLQVAAGDVLVAGTDGLFDNLYDNELMRIVIYSMRSGFGPQVTAQKLASFARERALDCKRQTPFSTAAQEAGFRFYGGKMDDITVIVSYVTSIKPGFSNSLPKL